MSDATVHYSRLRSISPREAGPNRSRVDVTVLADGWRRTGFKYAEIKPQSISGLNAFQSQVKSWNLRHDWGRPCKVTAISYNAHGNIFDGF